MNVRKEYEKFENNYISPFGCKSFKSKGRQNEEDECSIRTVFQTDKDRIVFSNGFRRLKHKTQVFLSPLGEHYRTRLTHTLEVAQIARTIVRALHFNEDLAEAIALGHDLGHTPFGHSGETVLKEIYAQEFCHNEQSLRVVDVLENNGKGLNLTYEVRDGILKHTKGFGNIIPEHPEETAETIEGRIVRIADIMAYLNHDLDDAIRSGVITREQVPDSCIKILGKSHSERLTTMIKDVIYSSFQSENEFVLKMSEDILSAMKELRTFLYDNVYRSHRVHKEFVKSKKILADLYYHFLKNKESLIKEMKSLEMHWHINNECPIERMVCDIIASMTDRNALELYSKIFIPMPLF
ncbi:MAG: deoxyguanosinetriphosphate triphosphohydrolase [Desulfobacterales bacterium]|nr:deoxyguanosinetriphosphate triphosphohydrolase [Desulfobacterales bacterium]